MSNIPEHFLKKIQEAKEKQLKELDLSCDWYIPDHQKLNSIPTEVFDLEHLEVLSLRNNRFSDIPKDIAQLSNLTSLYLSFNNLTTGLDKISPMQRLTTLDLSYNELTDVPRVISQLNNISTLNLAGNRLADIPEYLNRLNKLLTLDLSRNRITMVPEWIDELSNLMSLDLGINHLRSIPSSIGKLQNLTLLDLHNDELISIPDAIGQLQNLVSLNLSYNQLVEIPNMISQLHNLRSLNIGLNRLVSIPETIGQLRNLVSLDLRLNRLVTIPESIGNLKNLQKLSVSGNPIKTPPLEVVEKGVKAINDYFRQLEVEGQDYLFEAKLIIVGEGGAGKTTFVKKIENSNYQLQEEELSTKGIDVIQWHFPMDDERRFRVNIWDFGGQEIYHATHQFFLTKRSLYALVADTRKEDTDFYYWLNVVDLLSDSSPMVIIKNEKQDRHREINERMLREEFSNLQETLATNLATNRGFSEIIKKIKHHICQLPHIGTPLPKTWVKVREALEKDHRDHISIEDYLATCQENGFMERNDSLQLSGYLHDLGVCLHFQEDPLLKKTVILKPKWGTDAVYKVLDNKTVMQNLGQFIRTELTNIWDAPEYANMQDELLQLMINFKLCYKIPGSQDTYIAPQLLTENQPEYQWDEKNNLIMRYTYEFMLKGIITQFIVAMHQFIAAQKNVWKSGVILEKDQTRAEVIEYYGKREIRIRISGKHKKEMMAIVTYELEKIHASYRRLEYSQLIPCNCAMCRDSQEPHFYPYETLRKFLEDRQRYIQCIKSYQNVNVYGLINDLIDEEQIPDGQKTGLGSVADFSHRGGKNKADKISGLQKFTKMRVFVASPSNMATERTKVYTIVDSLKPLAEKQELFLEMVDWCMVVPDAGRPQQVIFDQLKPTTWDIFIGILWHRFGMPSGAANPATQKEYLSGTEEEFTAAYHLWQQFKKPRIMMYRCTRSIPPNALDADQFKRVQDFFAQLDPHKSDHPALYQSFNTMKNFEELLRENLQRVLLEYEE